MLRLPTLHVTRSLTLAILACSVTAAAAHPIKHRRRPVAPSADAIELAGIAPPSYRSTALQTYGDAGFARARFQRRYPAEEANNAAKAAAVGVPYPCDPRTAGPDAYVCRNDPRRLGYGQGYAITPAYVSAPQVVGVDAGEQTPVLPGVAGIAWAINALRLDPH